MKRRSLSFIAILFLILPLTVLTASADAGLKQILTVKVEGVTSPCYFTILRSAEQYEYDRPYEGDEDRKDRFIFDVNDIEEGGKTPDPSDMDTAYRRFKEYRDPDGYLFICQGAYLAEDGSFETYSVPYHYKVLMYCPASDTLSVSGKLAAPNLFTEASIKADHDKIVSASYSAVSRLLDSLTGFIQPLNSMIVTIIIELLIALCFLFTKGKQIRTVILVNLVSITLLNMSLLIFNPPVYGSLFSFPYALFEIIVTAAEAAAYLYFLPKYSKGKPAPKWRIITYAVVANLATYAFAALVPGYYMLAPLMLFFG